MNAKISGIEKAKKAQRDRGAVAKLSFKQWETIAGNPSEMRPYYNKVLKTFINPKMKYTLPTYMKLRKLILSTIKLAN
jgi:hypothetical protein